MEIFVIISKHPILDTRVIIESLTFFQFTFSVNVISVKEWVLNWFLIWMPKLNALNVKNSSIIRLHIPALIHRVQCYKLYL